MSFAARARARAPGRYGYLALPGTSGCYAYTADSAAVSVTGDIDIRVKVSLTDWTASTQECFLGKWDASGQFSYSFHINTSGNMILYTSSNGVANTAGTASAATGITDGTTSWVRVTRAASSGAILFYKSTNGSTWTQIGTDRSNTAGNLYDGTSGVSIGAQQTGGAGQPLNGHIYRAQIRSNILDDGSGIVFDADFTDTGRTFKESVNAATVTVNGTTAVASVHP